MDDRFLTEGRKDPEPGFARRLRERLHGIEADDEPVRRPRWQPALAGALAMAALVASFSLPAVRVAAQNLLDLFRVREFAVVQVDAHRMEQLKQRNFEPEMLFGGKVEKLQEPGPPQYFTSIDAASNAAGFAALRPTMLPRSLALDTVVVTGEARSRLVANTQPLRELMDTYDIHDLQIPAGLDGQPVSFHVPRVMIQRYKNAHSTKAAVIQATSPEVELPPGADIARLGEIGLRVLGLEPAEASRIAHTIDWRSTLLVPVVASATTFQQITIHGQRAVYLETNSTKTPDGTDRGPGCMVLWSENGKIYAVMGNLDMGAIVTMAESVR